MEVLVILAIVLGSLMLIFGLSCCIFGFRPVGVAFGSCAACCQSIIGNVVKGSCFAIMTCLGMKGCFIGLIIVGLLVLLGIGIYFMINSEWFQFAWNWVKNFISSLGLKAISMIVKEHFKYAYIWAGHNSFSKDVNNNKRFLHY